MDIDEKMERVERICELLSLMKELDLYDEYEAQKEKDNLSAYVGRYWQEEDAYLNREADRMMFYERR